MSSFKTYFKEELGPRLLGFLAFVAVCACFYGFVCIIPYMQRLPLFRLDTTDACWFSICCFIYLIPFCIVGGIALACITAVIALIVRSSVFFYKEIILKPGRTILIAFVGFILLYIGAACYATGLELVEYLS